MTPGQQSRHKEVILLLRPCAEAASDALDVRELFESLCGILARSGLFPLAWFGYADEGARKIIKPLVHSGDAGSFFEDLKAALRQTDYEDPANVALQSGEVCWIKDLRRDAAFAAIQFSVLERGLTSVVAFPVIWQHRPRGALTLYYSDPEKFGQPTVNLLTEWLIHIEAALTQRIPVPRVSQEGHEAELRALLDVFPQHIALLTAEGRVFYLNRVALDYLGYTLEEMKVNSNFVLHPDEVGRIVSTIMEGFSKGVPFECEYRIRRHDGQFRWFSTQLSPLRDQNGRLIRWCSVATDIHDRKLAAERLQNENILLREEIDRASMFEEIVGHSEKLQAVLGQVTKVAPTDSTVLITGQTGTGKELFARAIHRRSLRSKRAFVAVNCASIPTSLIATELFGHEKGAFTGANQQRLGRFELADGGTIFLDEVGELPPETQVALLRVLQERWVERVGGSRPIAIDVRVVAATNRDLNAAVAAGTFRQDLFYRLNVFPVRVPSLSDRAEDIPLLVEYFVGRYADRMGKRIRNVEKITMDLFQGYGWPGNVRELQNVVERAVILTEGETLCADETWFPIESFQTAPRAASLKTRLTDQEKDLIESALSECRGKVSGPSGAAAKLGIPAATLESKIRSMGINKHRFKN
jgi:formate hydrogenlyase transcriptional activator